MTRKFWQSTIGGGWPFQTNDQSANWPTVRFMSGEYLKTTNFVYLLDSNSIGGATPDFRNMPRFEGATFRVRNSHSEMQNVSSIENGFYTLFEIPANKVVEFKFSNNAWAAKTL